MFLKRKNHEYSQNKHYFFKLFAKVSTTKLMLPVKIKTAYTPVGKISLSRSNDSLYLNNRHTDSEILLDIVMRFLYI